MDGSPQVVRFDATTLWHLDAAEWAPSTASKADAASSGSHVRFTPQSGHPHVASRSPAQKVYILHKKLSLSGALCAKPLSALKRSPTPWREPDVLPGSRPLMPVFLRAFPTQR